jgi:CubicO group peptidase (beta-lactamase class C family)
MADHRAGRVIVLLLLAVALLSTSCTTPSPPQRPTAIERLRPDLMEFLADPALADVRAVIVAAGGRTVFETYPNGGPEDYHNVFSVTKSVASTLVGIAVDEGLLRLDQTLAELLPDHGDAMDLVVRATTLEQLLTMTGGFPDSRVVDASAFTPTSDWVALCLQSAVAPPGRQFAYSDVGAHLVGAVLVQATGRSVLQYAREKLFDPLGIRSTPSAEPLLDPADNTYEAAGFTWGIDPQGIHTASSNLAIRPPDMLAIGSLFLAEGRWRGVQVVSQTWVRQATAAHAPGRSGSGEYGYLWWVGTADGSPAYFAEGFGGQLIGVVPERELVVVVSTAVGGGASGASTSLLTDMVDEVIAPALA